MDAGDDIRRTAGTVARRFWTLALGVALREGATETTVADAVEEMMALLRPGRAPAGDR